jgi:hypothetical protein
MMPIVIRTKKRIFRYYTGFSFFVFIWISDLEADQARLIRHERIHFYQQLELLFVFHWLLYCAFYLFLRIKGQRHYIAYRYNPFEQEAYENDNDLTYARRRRLFHWVRYYKKFLDLSGQDISDSQNKIGW